MKNIYEPDFVKNLFDKMSSSYERMNYITSFGFSIRWRKQFLKKVGASDEPLHIIDLLSGLGENWKILKRNFPNGHFYALDFSEQMILNSKKKAKKVFGDNLNIRTDNILDSSLPENHFDIVTCAYGLKTFSPDQLDILASQISKALKPNGKFTFVEVSKPKNKVLLFFYGLYLGKLIPVLGKLFLGNPEDYKMLWIYTKNFKDTTQVKGIFEKHGLVLNIDTYFFGCASGISGHKA